MTTQSVLDDIDGALAAYGSVLGDCLSLDAMRWQPEAPEPEPDPELPAPVVATLEAMRVGEVTDWRIYFENGPHAGEREVSKSASPPAGWFFGGFVSDADWPPLPEPMKVHYYRYASRITYDGELVYAYEGVQ